MMDTFLGITLVGFIKCGLPESLLSVALQSEADLARLAIHALSFVIRTSTALLPEPFCTKHLLLPTLVQKAAEINTNLDETTDARPLELTQRAVDVLRMFSVLTGAGLYPSIATLLSRSAYEDAFCLASELLRSEMGDGSVTDLSIFPKAALDPAPAAGMRPSMTYSRNPTMSKLRVSSRRLFRTASKEVGNAQKRALFAQRSGSGLALEEQEAERSEAEFTVANRGHRRLMQKVVLTDLAFEDTERYQRVLTRSKVLLSKEWREWDWPSINELVAGPMSSHKLRAEILKTKFVKRVLGFFKPTKDGEFVNLEWTADFVPYANVGVAIIRMLVSIPEGITFLESDRRGKLHALCAAGKCANSRQLCLFHALIVQLL